MRYLIVELLLSLLIFFKSDLTFCTSKNIGENKSQKIETPHLPVLEFEDTLLVVKKKCYFNIRFKDNSKSYYMTISNGVVMLSDKKGYYKFMIVPGEKGLMKFSVFKRTKSGTTPVMIKYLSVF